jgi:Tfp pilus assembly protein PilO
MKIDLPPDIKTIVMPVGSLVILIILSVVLFKLGVTKLTALQTELTETQKEVQTLEQKNAILAEISPTIAQNASLFSFALPADDPSAMVISQLRMLSASSGVMMNSISSRPNTKEGTLPGDVVSINITGQGTGVFSFLSDLGTITPLVLVGNVAISQDKSGTDSADVTLNSYWSPYPETIPAATEPVVNLSDSENALIARMATYKVPTFTELTPQGTTSSRSSPF